MTFSRTCPSVDIESAPHNISVQTYTAALTRWCTLGSSDRLIETRRAWSARTLGPRSQLHRNSRIDVSSDLDSHHFFFYCFFFSFRPAFALSTSFILTYSLIATMSSSIDRGVDALLQQHPMQRMKSPSLQSSLLLHVIITRLDTWSITVPDIIC